MRVYSGTCSCYYSTSLQSLGRCTSSLKPVFYFTNFFPFPLFFPSVLPKMHVFRDLCPVVDKQVYKEISIYKLILEWVF